jgi:hypothetical protein
MELGGQQYYGIFQRKNSQQSIHCRTGNAHVLAMPMETV